MVTSQAQQLSHSLGPRSNTRAVILWHTLREKSLAQVAHVGLMGDEGGQTARRLGRCHHGCRGEDAVVAVVEKMQCRSWCC